VGDAYQIVLPVIREELGVQVAIGRPLDTPEGLDTVASLIADMVARCFGVRERERVAAARKLREARDYKRLT
jgi:hypothetical protein